LKNQKQASQSTKVFVYSEFHSNRIEIGVVIPHDAISALDEERGLERLLNGFTAELLQATLSYKLQDGDEGVC